MSIRVTNIAFTNELKTNTTDWLLANRKDKIVATIDFEVKTVAISSTSNPFIIKNTDGYLGTHWVTSNNNDFADFRVGDTVIIYDRSTASVTATTDIIEKLSDNEVRMTLATSPYGLNTETATVNIYVTTPITAVRFKWNLIENNEPTNYLSRLTGQLQEAIIEEKLANDTSTTTMLLMGGKEWQNGTVQIKGVSIGSTGEYVSKYQLIHTFFVENFDIFNDDFDRYLNGNCLKYIYDITALYEFTNPNRLQQTISDEVLGNVGNYDENFNNRPTNYSISSVVYTDATPQTIDAVELTSGETDFVVTIQNTTDTPFSNNNTKFVLHFGRVPDAIDYTNTGENIDATFWNDRVVQTVGSAAVNGINFGTATQIFKDVTATFVSTSEITIQGKIALATDIVNDLPFGYEFSVAIQKHTLQTADADKVTLLIDRSEFYQNVTDLNMIIFERNGYIIHPNNSDAALNTTPTTFRYDEGVGYCLFYIDRLTRETDDISITSFNCNLKAKNSVSNADFILEQFTFNSQNLPIVNGHQFISSSTPRPFKIPNTEIRKNIVINRRDDLDTATKIYYEMYYPFMIRWEYWVALANVNGAFFNQSEPNNGFNQNWFRYDDLTNWNIFFEFDIKATKNGEPQRYQDSFQVEVKDYLSNPDWINETIKIRKKSDDSDVSPYLLAYEDCYAHATFESSSLTFANTDDLVVVFSIEQFEQGGVNGRDRASSRYAIESSSIFTGSVALSLSGGGTVVEAKVDIDIAKLAALEGDFTIVPRIYYPAPVMEDYKQFADYEFFEFEDNIIYEFQ
jgi:hypothetical protein